MAEGPRLLTVVTTARFKKDAKRDRKRGKDMNRLIEVVDALRHRRALAAQPDPAAALATAGYEVLRVSALRGQGLETLARRMAERLLDKTGEACAEEILAPNRRQREALSLALAELEALGTDVRAGRPEALLGVGLETACAHLAAVTGEIVSDEILADIFSRFCIGK